MVLLLPDRQHHRRLLLGAALIAVASMAASGCASDRDVTAPRPVFEQQSQPPPDDCTLTNTCTPPDGGGGGTPFNVYYDSLDVNSETFYREIPADSAAYFSQSPPGGAATICDRTLTGSVTSLVDLPGTKVTYSVHSSGTWTMDLQLTAGLWYDAVYNWPRGPVMEGYWRATNLNTFADTYIFIERVLAHCDILETPDGRFWKGTKFIRFYGVRARDNQMRIRPGSDDGNQPGSGSMPAGCSDQWVILDVDYGDGTGWHQIWEGWAKVCSS